jgi:hypothetical protein
MEIELDYYYKIIIASLEFELAQKVASNSTLVALYQERINRHGITAKDYYDKRQLSKLKKMWSYFFEAIREKEEIAQFEKYLKQKYNLSVMPLLEKFIQRCEKIIEKGKVSSDSQYAALRSYLDMIIPDDNTDVKLIERIDEILESYDG